MKSARISLNMLFVALVLMFVISCNKNQKTETGSQDEIVETPIVDPEEIFENEYVKAVMVSLKPNEALASHDASKRVIYSLTNYTIRWEENGEDLGAKSWKEGDTHAHDASVHSATNIGSSTAEWVAFVRKDEQLPDCSPYSIDNDVNAVSPDFTKLLLDNENLRITEVSLPAEAEIPTHAGMNRLVYSLSDYEIQFESDKSGSREKAFTRGDTHWHEGCMHSVKNIGTSVARFLVISFKVSENG